MPPDYDTSTGAGISRTQRFRISQTQEPARMHERKTSPASLQSSESAVAQAVNVSKYIAAASTLHPPQELQRGVSIASTLSPFNNLFAKLPDRLDREDRERLYERSRPVCAIDSFISHAWRSEGWSKWMALALHEVGLAPLVVGIVASLLMAHLQRNRTPRKRPNTGGG